MYERENVCRLDLYQRFIFATIIDQGDITIEHQFGRTQTDLSALRNEVLYHAREVLACESTSDYQMQYMICLRKRSRWTSGEAGLSKWHPKKDGHRRYDLDCQTGAT